MRKVGRYILVEELNLEKRHLFSYKERVEDLYKKINEYNNKKDNPYFIGDLTFNWKTRTLYYRRYRKITKPSSLNILDDVTTKLENEASLKKKFKIENDNRLFVAYRVNRKIKFLDIFYKKDVKYLNEYYLESKFIEYSKDIKFLKIIINNNLISSFKFSLNEYEALFYHVNNGFLMNSKPVIDLVQAFIRPNGVKSYINFRFLSSLIREYESTLNAVEEEKPIFYSDEIDDQIMINGYEVGILSHFNEDLKMGEIKKDKVIKKLIR